MQNIEDIFSELRVYCEKEEFIGWDPFDGLNAPIIQHAPLKHLRIFRLCWIQLFKRLPINLRQLFFVPEGYNPKGLALFVSGYCNWYQAHKDNEVKDRIRYLITTLLLFTSEDYENTCWGYNFDWQSRAFFLPKGTPNVIVTTFAGHALLDAHEALECPLYFKKAISVGNFILHDLGRTTNPDGTFCFSYSPKDASQIFNASLLAARYLSRLYSVTKNSTYKEEAKKTIEYCIRQQKDSGEWCYGSAHNQQWIDSFHTGYNLEALFDYEKYTGDTTYRDQFEKGFAYYVQHFFADDGTPKYYAEKTYPVDIHAVSELMVLLCRTGRVKEHKALLDRVLRWTVQHMWDERQGYFYYQKHLLYTNTIPYIRWAQAWMFYALSLLIVSEKREHLTGLQDQQD